MNTGILSSLFRRALVLMVAIVATLPLTISPAIAGETTFTFNGGGWGHGIGMSQYGARGYALKGWKYDEILQHYYQDTKLVTKDNPKVRVNLAATAKGRSQWKLKAGTSSALTIIQKGDSTNRITLDAANAYWVVTTSGKTQVYEDSSGKPGKLRKTFPAGTGCYASSGGASGAIKMLGTSGPYNHTGVTWRGTIHFIPTSPTSSLSKAVNWVYLERYLYGVVPRESPASWPAEALKAQAVAARSYAYQDAKTGRTIYCTTMSQVYNGWKGPKGGEEPQTNAAVDATKGKVVWYGSETKPVQTFFFSSSGGHTANIEDVWTAAAARPYYRGVEDADKEGNPYYTWSVGPLPTSDVSVKVRSRVGSNYSAPAPHTITSMTVDRASSGHARYVNVAWSNGQSYRIKGDTLRSVLSLRSTNYRIVNNNPPGSYQQTSSLLAWSGIWQNVSKPSASGGTYRRTSMKYSRCVIKFDGTGISWIGYKSPYGGKAEVYLDGKLVTVVDQYSSSAKSKQKLFTRTGLAPGEHTLVIRVLGASRSGAKGKYVYVDRVDITGGKLLQAPAVITRYQESHSKMAKLGGWKTSVRDRYYGGERIWNTRTGATVILDFHGTGIRWHGSKGPNYGKATVSINGGTPKTIDMNAPSLSDRALLFETKGLKTNTRHRIEIKVLGPSSGGIGGVAVDRLDVIGGWAYAPRLDVIRVQQSNSRVVRSSGWKTARESGSSGGSHIVSNVKGSDVKVRFEGTSIKWIGARSPRSGRAAVYLDGVRVATVDQYGSSIRYKQKLFTKSGLSAGPHELRIRVLGTKRAAARGTYINVDAFDIAGRLAP